MLRRMNWHLLGLTIAVVGLSTATGAGGASEDACVLAQNGTARMPVVLRETADESVRKHAEELSDYLGRITGGTFPVQTGDGSSGIVVGTLEQLRPVVSEDVSQALAFQGPFDGNEAYAIRTSEQRMLLVGATPLAVGHAVARLLEEVGYRHFFPAPEWEVVPSHPTLSVSLNIDDRPTILARRIWYGYGFFDRGRGKSIEDYRTWSRHNRMAQSLRIYCGHAWDRIMRERQTAFDAHPEYRGLLHDKKTETGKRKGNKFCISNPDLRQLVVDWAVEFFERYPERDMVSVDPSDGGGHCQCEACAAVGTTSDNVFLLANEVARAVAKEHPGKMVGLYAYNQHSEPPSFELEPNVYVQLTAGFIRGRWTLAELLDLWPEKCRNMGFYEYFSVYLWNWDMLPGGRGANVEYITDKIRDYVARGATSLDAESGNNWGLHGRGYYVANKLMWNPNQDVDALLADFYEKAFGPAAEPMRRYYERFDPGNQPLMSRHLIAQGFRDVAEATRLAKGRPDVLARLDHIKIYLRYFHLRWMLQRAETKEEKKNLTLEALTHVYRNRYTYMNHWEAMRQHWTRHAAKDFDEPSWSFKAKGDHPWQVDKPCTSEEIAAFFQEGLEHFQLQDVAERDFSDDLIPVDDDSLRKRPTNQRYQGGLRYALYSKDGSPLTVDVTTGTIAWYRDRADARYTFLSADEKVLKEGRLALDGEVHTLTADVPGPGLYFFDFNDTRAGWRIQAEAGVPCTILLRRDRGFRHSGHMQPMYFYVPKGTETLHYYWKGGPHDLYTPKGEKLKRITTSGAFVSVDIPEGMDGTFWYFRRLALGHLFFFNAPNCLAGAPASLLLPRDVVEADGLNRQKE